MRSVQPGSTDVSVRLLALDSTTGAPKTSIAYNTTGIDIWYQRENAEKVGITEVALAGLTTSHTDGGVLHISDGYFRVDVPDAAFAAGSATVMIGGIALGADIVAAEIQLRDDQSALRSGTATGGAASTVILDASASTGTDFYAGNVVQLVSGTGAGQARMITAYNGTTKVATVDRAWATNPISGTVFRLLPFGVTGMTTTQVAEAVWNAVSASYNTALTTGAKLTASGSASVPPTTAEITTALLAASVATGITVSDSLRMYMAALGGKRTKTGSTVNFRNMEDTKNAISATVNTAGDRLTIVLNLTQ